MYIYFLAVDPPVAGLPLPVETVGSLIQPGIGAYYDYYLKKKPKLIVR
jgi:hypothetical protein